jgi:photosystem II stability/assembly factor-like uncharacterized protein
MSGRSFPILLLGCLVLLSACGEDKPTTPPQRGWYPLGLEGSQVNRLELHDPYLYACASKDGLFRVGATGTNPDWECLGFAGEWCYDVKVLDEGTILVGLSSGVQRSEDDGLSWARSDSGIVGDACTVTCFATCGDLVLAGTVESGLYRSEDRGLSWTRIAAAPGEGYSHRHVHFHTLDCNHIWLTGMTNRGVLLPLLSIDRGDKWESIRLMGYTSLNWCYSIGLDPYDAGVVYLGLDGLVLKTIDSGSSWATVFHPPGEPCFFAIEADRESRGHVFFAGGDSLYETHDGGASIESIGSANGTYIFDLTYDEARRILYASTAAGAFKYVL